MDKRSERLLGIDYGEQRIGIAVSDGSIAVPLAIVEHEGRANDLARVAQIAREKLASRVVIGLPLLQSGDEGEQARRCRRFGEALGRMIEAPILYCDESFSSVAAQVVADTAPRRRSKAGGKPGIDDLAAAVILQSYIDGERAERERERGR